MIPAFFMELLLKSRGVTRWLLILFSIMAALHTAEAAEARVVCYYTNWSVYRPGTAKFNPQNINPYLCTHLIYAFGGFTKENTLKPFDKYQDIEKGGYAKFTGLKTYNKNLKTMIAIGGWNEGSSRFSSLVASSERRRELVKNAVKFMRQNKFDGLDLDWEYPAFRDGGKPKDRANYARLVQELREEFEKESEATGRSRLLLTMAVPAGIEYIDKGYDVPKLNKYLDWMNILSYDYHSAFEPAVNHHSPLFALEAASEYNFDSELNIDYTINHYLEAGADPDKLVLGIPTYGRSFTLFNPDSTAIGAPADGPGEQGDATREKGYLAYYEICESLLPKSRRRRDTDSDEDSYEDEEENEQWTVVQPNAKAMGPYAYKGNQWVGYDDIDIVRKKAEYVAEKGLGGIMFWSIDNDDFRGKCHGKPYPLIEAAKESLLKSLGLTDKSGSPKKTQPSRKRPRPSKPAKTQNEDEKEITKNTVRNTRKRTRPEESNAYLEVSTKSSSSSRRRPGSRQGVTSSPSPVTSTTPAWGLNTPEPPTTPDPGSDFKCEEEGFFPHPRDCKKYFWCLESGPSNLGIVAHQFTCPSGLHFNKAADSCDFARNVLCKTKTAAVTSAPAKATTTTRTSTTTTTERATTNSAAADRLAALFTTRRPAPKVTAATSSTTLLFKTTTTVSPQEEEYDELEEELEEQGVREAEAEEDPKVIKELIDLIKKLGGIEQLEKHLAATNAGSNNGGSGGQGVKTTTPATITRLLYERVLAKLPQGERAPPQQNSRGPQAVGLRGAEGDDGLGVRRERPQYTTINRHRSSTTTEESLVDQSDDEESEEEVSQRASATSSRPGLPQYVNIRRGRPSTTENPEPTARNALFERDSEESNDDEDSNKVQEFEYTTAKRRPETSTFKYQTIQRVRSTTTEAPASEEVKEELVNEEIKPLNPTEIPVSSSSPNSPQYVTVSRLQSTVTSNVETTTPSQGDNDVSKVNDLNLSIASPSFASENGVIKNTETSTVLNAKITTFSNSPKASDENGVPLNVIPISYSTEVTISEEPLSSTQKSALFAKRTRPTTTTTEKSELSTSANKVSPDRKYASIKRTRTSASLNTPSPLLRARLNNDIVDDSGKELDDDSDLGETSRTVISSNRRQVIRKIRSTTPASQENQQEEAEVERSDYGSKRFVRPSRPTGRRLASTSTVQEESENVRSPSNGENGLVTRAPGTRNTFGSNRAIQRPRKFQLPNYNSGDNVESGNEFVGQFETKEPSSSARPQPVRRFRPSTNTFDADFSSLTALDNSRNIDDNGSPSTGIRNSQVSRRFRPTFRSTTNEPIQDSEDSDSSVSTAILPERQRSFGFRGSRFTTAKTTANSQFELNTEASEASVVARARKIGIARFSPRPFSRTTAVAPDEIDYSDDTDLEEENELNAEIAYDPQLIGKARLTAPVINVSGEKSDQPSRISLQRTQPAINVTKVISSNVLLGQTNDKNGILILRRPSVSASRNITVTNVSNEIKIEKENIYLSESNIEEKEHEEDNNTQVSERPRKRIIVKKLRSTVSETPTTESITSEIDATENLVKTSVVNENQIGKSDRNETVKPKVRRVLKRRPATTTTQATLGNTESDDKTLSSTDASRQTPETTTLPRVRKVIRKKIKSVLTEEGKIRLLQTENKEQLTTDKVEKEDVTTQRSTLNEASVSEDVDELAESSTPLPSTKAKVERPSYRPAKRPLNVVTSTETPTTTAKVYSRKYINGPFTTPISPADREQVFISDRPQVTARKPNFNAIRRPFTTARTTTTDEEENYDIEDGEEQNEEEKLVFVPLDQLFTRGPTGQVLNTGRQVGNQDLNVEEEYSNEEEEEEVIPKIIPTVRPGGRFNIPQKPNVVINNRGGISNIRETNRPQPFNRPGTARPTTEETEKRFNRPVAYQPPNRPNRFGPTTTVSPQEVGTKAYVRKYTANKPASETSPIVEEVNVEAVNAKRKQIFNNPKRFTTTTQASTANDGVTDENEDVTTDVYSETTTYLIDQLSETEVPTVTEDSTIMDSGMFNDVTTDISGLLEQSTVFDLTPSNTELPTIATSKVTDENSSSEKTTTEPHHVFAVDLTHQNDSKTEDNTVYPVFDVSTISVPYDTTTETNNASSPFVSTSTQLDRLFAVSRIVEVSSKQDKHRLNSKNESRLIESGEIKQEKKPTLDKIGEVSRFTLIKIVEGDIPIYLTNLSHEYPVDNPPFNPIRIDEARNARALNNFTDSGKENLIASESVNAAYNSRNGFADYSNPDNQGFIDVSKDNEHIHIVESSTFHDLTTTPVEPSTANSSPPMQYQFVPGAVSVDDIKQNPIDIITPRSNVQGETATLALEGLFKSSEDPDALMAKQAESTVPKTERVGSQPFVVYAAPVKSIESTKVSSSETANVEDESARVASGRSLANFVKLQVLRPDEEPIIKTYAKGVEFLGVPAAVDVMMEKENTSSKPPITIKILNQTANSEQPSKVPSIPTTEPIVISIANLDRVVLQQTGVVNLTTQEPEKTTIEEMTTVVSITTTDSSSPNVTEAAVTDSKISVLKIKPIVATNGTLSNFAKKRPKLTFPRRPQSNQPKASNITRIVSPSATNQTNKARPVFGSASSKNIPYTTPKYNRTNSYTSGKSRFTANRAANAPVDTRKANLEVNKSKPNVTSETPKPPLVRTTDFKKVTIKPFRSGLLRSSSFTPRRLTTVPPQISFETTTQDPSLEVIAISPPSENSINVQKESKPTFFPRRPANRLNLSRLTTTSTTTEAAPSSTTDPSHRFSSTGNSRRKPGAFDRRRPGTTSPFGGRNKTDASSSTSTARAPVSRPTKLFVRKHFSPRTNSTARVITLPTTTPRSLDITSKRNFRIGVRRRPTFGVVTTTVAAKTTPDVTTVPGSLLNEEGAHDQESHSTIQQPAEKNSAEVNRRKIIKVQRRPVSSALTGNQAGEADVSNAAAETTEKTRGEKIYSSVIKEDKTLVQEEKKYDRVHQEDRTEEYIGDVTMDVALAAHQLISAPLPTIPAYALDDQAETEEERKFTRAYLMASPSSPIISPNDFAPTRDYSRNRVKYTTPTKSRRISTTVAPRVVYASSVATPILTRRRPAKVVEAFAKINPVTYRTFVDYEYYDDDDVRVVGRNPQQEKVILHGTGVIQCLDQGNFPHPESCKKFISCAKMENGGVVGWAYTCPRGLSYDPVGGICNWSAGLGCKE